MDHLKVQLGDNWVFSVPPKDYLIPVKDNNNKDACVVGISGAEMDFTILGDSFMRTYYSIHDYQNHRAGLALHIYSDGYLERKFPTWIIVVIVISGLIILAVIFFCLYRYYKKRQVAKRLEYYNRVQNDIDRKLYGGKDTRNEWIVNSNSTDYERNINKAYVLY